MASAGALVSTLVAQHRVGGVLKKLNEVVFQVPLGREGTMGFTEPPYHLQVLQKLIGKLVFFDLAYLKEIGRGDQRSRWRDNEEVYFVAALLGQLSFTIRKLSQQGDEQERLRDFVSFNENKILSKCTIGIVVPFPALVRKYEEVLNERLLHRFSLSNVQIGSPAEFYGVEKDIMIISSFRNSVD